MNELDEIVYALEDLDLSDQKLKVLTNKGVTGGPQGNFLTREGSNTLKEEVEPENIGRSFVSKAKRSKYFVIQYHNNNKSKYTPNRLPKGDVGTTQFQDLDCKREPELDLDEWGKNIFLFFLLGKGVNYTEEEKYIIAIDTFTGKVSNWHTGLSDDAKGIIKNHIIEGFKKIHSRRDKNSCTFIGNEFLGNEGSASQNREKIRIIAKEQLEKITNLQNE